MCICRLFSGGSPAQIFCGYNRHIGHDFGNVVGDSRFGIGQWNSSDDGMGYDRDDGLESSAQDAIQKRWPILFGRHSPAEFISWNNHQRPIQNPYKTMKKRTYVRPMALVIPLESENICLVNSGITSGVIPGMSWENSNGTTNANVPGMSWGAASYRGEDWQEYERP